MNDELFYDAQLNNTKLTWGLSKKDDDNEILTGILDENDYSYGVGHSYGDATKDYDKLNIASKIAEIGNEVSNTIRGGTMIADQAVKAFDSLTGAKYGTNENSTGLGEHYYQESLIESVNNGRDVFAKFLGLDKETLKDAYNTLKYGRWFNPLDYIKTYDGTRIDFRLPDLRTIILSRTGESGGSVRDKIKELNDIFIGDVTQAVGIQGIQVAPNNYMPNFDELSENLEYEGTFRLRLGDGRTIKNLIVTDYNVVLSKMMRKTPKSSGTPDYLYAEVTVSVVPASFVTKEMLNSYFKLGQSTK